MDINATTLSSGTSELLQQLLLKESVTEFYTREADLLDHRELDSWLDLFAEDATYLVPLQRNVKYGDWSREKALGPLDAAWISDTKETLSQRIEQIQTGVHWAEEPLSRAVHLVTNVRILGELPGGAQSQEISTRARVLVYRNRVERETDLIVGMREDTLRRVDGDWKIVKRVVFIEQNVLLSKNLTLFF
jgi:3-phenylpropionate/cinnamic acid dioxygenase small subunit